MAATKEGLAIVLDVGPGMTQAPPGQTTDLQTSLEAIGMILQRKMFSQSKDEICLILCGTTDTANELSDGTSYENITVARPMGPVDWNLLQYVQNDVQPSNVSADFLDAIVVGMDHLMKQLQGKKGFASKRLILFSNLCGEFADDQLDDIVASIKEADVEFNVIGPALDDDDDSDDDEPRPGPSNGQAKAKTPQQLAGETLLRHILNRVEGESYSFSEALPALSYFQSRQVRSTAWKSQLTIGSGLQIPINMYNRIKEAKPSAFKNVYAKDPDAELERLRTFHLKDEEETEIEKSDTVDGHRYGSTLVPFSEDDKDAMKYKTEKCFKLLCFTKNDNISRHCLLGDATWVVTAEKGDEAASVALSALMNAMYETNTVAVVRRVYQSNSQVKVGCLVPHIKANYECLVYNELPFLEDLRTYTFGSLPVTEENTAANKKLTPSAEQLSLMDDLIDNMDLTTAAKDADGDACEALKPKLTFNPHLQRLYQCLEHRALNPDEALPELSEIVANYIKPIPSVEVQCQSTVDKMKAKFKLELIAKDKKNETGENMFKMDEKGEGPAAKKIKLDDDDELKGGMAELIKAKVTEVGTVSPVEDFRALLMQKDEDKFEEACKMMQKRVSQLITDSFGSQFYEKAMDCLKALRKETIKNSEPQTFNDFLVELKESLAEKGTKDFWEEIVQEKVSLISKLECEESRVTKSAADDFLLVKQEVVEDKPAESHDQADDLLNDM